jgi:hypothetical protein
MTFYGRDGNEGHRSLAAASAGDSSFFLSRWQLATSMVSSAH